MSYIYMKSSGKEFKVQYKNAIILLWLSHVTSDYISLALSSDF